MSRSSPSDAALGARAWPDNSERGPAPGPGTSFSGGLGGACPATGAGAECATAWTGETKIMGTQPENMFYNWSGRRHFLSLTQLDMNQFQFSIIEIVIIPM